MTRQNLYKARKRRQKQEVDKELIVELVKTERQLQPRIGCRKLRHLIGPELEEAGVEIGRNRFFDVLRGEDLLVKPRKKKARTTDSRHTLPVFGNLVKDRLARGRNEIWVGDLTYIRTLEGFRYLSLIMDLGTRKVIGHHLSKTLESLGCVHTLEMALKELVDGESPIHHTDRGCQYCCHEYVDRLMEKGLGISMTEENHCYENAFAERVIGILKQEYLLDERFRDHDQAQRAVDQAIHLYNTRRPHSSLGYRTPAEAYSQAA
jgi:putative transposase